MDAMPKNTANADNPAKSNMSQPRSIEGAWKFASAPRTDAMNQSGLTLELSLREVKSDGSLTFPPLPARAS